MVQVLQQIPTAHFPREVDALLLEDWTCPASVRGLDRKCLTEMM